MSDRVRIDVVSTSTGSVRSGFDCGKEQKQTLGPLFYEATNPPQNIK